MEDLKVASLINLHQLISTHNDQIGEKIVALEIARNNLKISLDAPDTGLIDIAQKTKDSIISSYGFESFESKQVRKLAFKREE